MFARIHSVDSLGLAEEIGRRAGEAGIRARVLVQVNTSGEESKFGLMTIGAFLPDPEAVRPCFVRLREVQEQVAAAKLSGVSMAHLSMGMTGDFELAIEEGATMVRVGTAIFGAREG